MAVIQSEYAKGSIAIPYPSLAGGATTFRFAMAVPTTVQANDILELARIPGGCRVTEIVLDSDDLDSDGTPAITLDVGIMSGNWGDPSQSRTCGAEFFSASNVGQAGGVARPTLASAYRQNAADNDRSIGVKIGTVADAAQAGSVGLTLTVVG